MKRIEAQETNSAGDASAFPLYAIALDLLTYCDGQDIVCKWM